MAMPMQTFEASGDARWAAVLRRDRLADGAFVYAVRSTGIYCRPSCPSRRPARDRVQFFDSPPHAEEAGFRACRRCHPQRLQGTDPDAELASRIVRMIEADRSGKMSLRALSSAVGRSPRHIQRTLQRVLGVSPRQFAAARRVGRLKARLKAGDSVTRAQYEAGFGSSSRLYERASETLGMTPATYRRGGAGARIGYTVVATSLGPLLVAGTERGLCGVRFGTSEAALHRSLRAEFPEAELERDEPRACLWAAALRAQADGLRPASPLPLDVRATAFQSRVWRELRRIPFGETRTYGQLARRLGHPRAARAVARACATNPAALAIPCHRVIREDGDLGGYRWGMDRKRELLIREAGSVKGEA